MAIGNYLVQGDKTTCGGVIIEGDTTHTLFGKPIARELDRVTCGKHPGMFNIAGGIANDIVHGRKMAGTLDSKSTCPCQARFVPSLLTDIYEKTSDATQFGQSANKKANQSDSVNLNYKITLAGEKILTPLAVPDYKEMINGGGTKNTEKIEFSIINKGDEAEGFSLEVLDGNELIYSERNTSKFFTPGEHAWFWDGYSNEGILDTRKLKSKGLLVRLIALRGEKMIKVDYQLKNSPKEQDWVDVLVNRKNQTVDVFWRVAFNDGGIDGNNPILQPVSYIDLQRMAKEGIELYWSRNGSRSSGIGDNISTAQGIYKVTVNTSINIEPSMSSFDLVEVLDSDFGRSTSLKGFRKVCHNLGFYHDVHKHSLPQHAYSQASILFKITAAHEMGHRVLDKYAPWSFTTDYSWTHKGSSSLSQNPVSGTVMPATGEIDIMRYAEKQQSLGVQEINSVANGDDVKGLIWLSRVKFDD